MEGRFISRWPWGYGFGFFIYKTAIVCCIATSVVLYMTIKKQKKKFIEIVIVLVCALIVSFFLPRYVFYRRGVLDFTQKILTYEEYMEIATEFEKLKIKRKILKGPDLALPLERKKMLKSWSMLSKNTSIKKLGNGVAISSVNNFTRISWGNSRRGSIAIVIGTEIEKCNGEQLFADFKGICIEFW